ncbi:MAG: hypothetical protein ACRD6I_19920 [Candidatus Acidiferrales bacterium]
MATKVALMSNPVTRHFPIRASSIAKYPGPGATSSTLALGGKLRATRSASALNSAESLPIVAAYHFAILPSMPMPL